MSVPRVHRDTNNQAFLLAREYAIVLLIKVKLKLITRMFSLCKSSQCEVLECLCFAWQKECIYLVVVSVRFSGSTEEARKMLQPEDGNGRKRYFQSRLNVTAATPSPSIRSQ